MKLKPGKLPPDLLQKLVEGFVIHDSVSIGPGIGFDSAVIDIGKEYLVVTSDPITFVTEDIGYYTVAVNINDIAVTGAEPSFMTLTVLISQEDADSEKVSKIFNDVRNTAREYGISVIGGHTEVTPSIESTITSATMMGFVEKHKLVRQDGAKPGDVVVMMGLAGVEGTSIIARELDLSGSFSTEEIERMKNFYRDPGIIILDKVRCLKKFTTPTSMHDPTEGGIAQAIHELARASNTGFLIEFEKIPVHPLTLKLSKILDFNYLGLISSGSLIATVKESEVSRISCPDLKIIGKVTEKSSGVKLLRQGRVEDLPRFPQDEITKILA